MFDRSALRELVKLELDKPEQLFVTLYYFEGLTYAEIGEVLGRTEADMRHEHECIMGWLRARIAR